MELSQTIYTLRTAKGLSQLELAEQLEVSRQSVSKWETGQSVPDLDKLIKLADLFGISVDELVRADAQPTPPEPEVVYIREKPQFTPVQKAGAVLEIVGLLGVVLGGLGLMTLIGAGLMLLGLPLLLSRRHPWLWLGWMTVVLSLLVLSPYTSIAPWGLIGGMRILYMLCIDPEMRYHALYLAAAVGIVRGVLVLLLLWQSVRAWKKRRA